VLVVVRIQMIAYLFYAIVRRSSSAQLRSGQSLEQQVLVCERKFHEGMAAVNVQFLADVIAMSVDCARADEELLCDLFAGFVFSKQREDAKLGRREAFQT